MVDQIQDIPVATIVDSRNQPARTMASHPHPVALKEGEFPLLQNVRCDDKTIRCRDGIAFITTTGLPTGSDIFRGTTLWKGKLYAAYRTAARANSWGAIDLYESSDAATWTKITSEAAGQQGTDSTGDSGTSGGDNRLNDNSFASFVPLTAPLYNFNQSSLKQNVDLLAVSTGDHSTSGRGCQPRILNGSASGLVPPAVAIHRTVDYPKVSGLTSRVGLPRSFQVPLFTPGSSDGGLGVAVPFTTAGGLSAPLITIFGGLTTNSGDKVGFTGVANDTTPLSNWEKRQFLVVYRTAQPEVIEGFKFTVTDGGNEYTVYDPADDTTTLALIPFGETDHNLYLAVYTADPTAVTNADYDGFNVEWKGAAMSPNSDIYLRVFAIAWGGNWPGLGQYAISYLNSSSMAESPAAVLDIGPSLKISDLGGSTFYSDDIPEQTFIFYEPRVPVPSPSTAERNRGVDTVLLYRREDGEAKYYLVNGTQGDAQFAEYTAGAWAWKSPWSAANQTQWHTFPNNEGRNGARLSPTAFCKGIQPFSCGDVASGRGVFGSESRLQISESGNPFRHQEIVNADEFGNLETWSASEIRIDGETCKQIDSVASSILGAQQAFVWTDKGLYAVDTSDPRLGASYAGAIGISAPNSLGAKDGMMWFLSDDRQVRFLGGGQMSEPSQMRVEDYLQSPATVWDGTTRGIPQGYLQYACGVWFRDRYYLAITPNGGTRNTQVLVYDPRIDAWYLDVPASGFSCQGWVVFPDSSSGRDRLLAFGHDGSLGEYEKPGQATDFGTAIPVVIDTPEFHATHDPIRLLRVGVNCDPIESTSMTITRTFRTGSGTVASTVSLDPDDPTQGWKWSNHGEGGRGVGCRLRLSVSAPAQWRLYSVVAEVEAPGGRGAGV